MLGPVRVILYAGLVVPSANAQSVKAERQTNVNAIIIAIIFFIFIPPFCFTRLKTVFYFFNAVVMTFCISSSVSFASVYSVQLIA